MAFFEYYFRPILEYIITPTMRLVRKLILLMWICLPQDETSWQQIVTFFSFVNVYWRLNKCVYNFEYRISTMLHGTDTD